MPDHHEYTPPKQPPTTNLIEFIPEILTIQIPKYLSLKETTVLSQTHRYLYWCALANLLFIRDSNRALKFQKYWLRQQLKARNQNKSHTINSYFFQKYSVKQSQDYMLQQSANRRDVTDIDLKLLQAGAKIRLQQRTSLKQRYLLELALQFPAMLPDATLSLITSLTYPEQRRLIKLLLKMSIKSHGPYRFEQAAFDTLLTIWPCLGDKLKIDMIHNLIADYRLYLSNFFDDPGRRVDFFRLLSELPNVPPQANNYVMTLITEGFNDPKPVIQGKALKAFKRHLPYLNINKLSNSEQILFELHDKLLKYEPYVQQSALEAMATLVQHLDIDQLPEYVLDHCILTPLMAMFQYGEICIPGNNNDETVAIEPAQRAVALQVFIAMAPYLSKDQLTKFARPLCMELLCFCCAESSAWRPVLINQALSIIAPYLRINEWDNFIKQATEQLNLATNDPEPYYSSDAHYREDTLKALKLLILHLNSYTQWQPLLTPIQARLNDKKKSVKTAAQKVITELAQRVTPQMQWYLFLNPLYNALHHSDFLTTLDVLKQLRNIAPCLSVENPHQPLLDWFYQSIDTQVPAIRQTAIEALTNFAPYITLEDWKSLQPVIETAYTTVQAQKASIKLLTQVGLTLPLGQLTLEEQTQLFLTPLQKLLIETQDTAVKVSVLQSLHQLSGQLTSHEQWEMFVQPTFSHALSDYSEVSLNSIKVLKALAPFLTSQQWSQLIDDINNLLNNPELNFQAKTWDIFSTIADYIPKAHVDVLLDLLIQGLMSPLALKARNVLRKSIPHLNRDQLQQLLNSLEPYMMHDETHQYDALYGIRLIQNLTEPHTVKTLCPHIIEKLPQLLDFSETTDHILFKKEGHKLIRSLSASIDEPQWSQLVSRLCQRIQSNHHSNRGEAFRSLKKLIKMKPDTFINGHLPEGVLKTIENELQNQNLMEWHIKQEVFYVLETIYHKLSLDKAFDLLKRFSDIFQQTLRADALFLRQTAQDVLHTLAIKFFKAEDTESFNYDEFLNQVKSMSASPLAPIFNALWQRVDQNQTEQGYLFSRKRARTDSMASSRSGFSEKRQRTDDSLGFTSSPSYGS